MDAIDRKVVAQLQADGRTTLKELAQITGFTSMGTKKRLERLIQKEIIKVSALINPDVLKLHPAIITLEMESAEAMQELLDRFEQCPRVIQIFKTIGGFNLIALVVAETQETLESISMEKCSLRCSGGIRRSELYPVSDTYFSPFLQIRENLAHKGKKVTPCKMNVTPATDMKPRNASVVPPQATIKFSLS
jgi:DNA-binding Lrp family transcriptional regulator